MLKKSPQILECTLRDGSYALDFQFSEHDTSQFVKALDQLGFPFIEVGHGIGLGASEKNMAVAAATDQQYMAATRDSITNGKWGMFCIPGIADLSHVDMAAEHDMDFIRIGCEVDQVEEAQAFIERARSHGIYVFSNLMKSYTASVDYFVEQAGKCLDYGAQCIYVVDSAGGMLPDEIRNYAEGIRAVNPEVLLGFHGHNNLGMGVANALACAEQDFFVIDTSLQGYGRSAGNTPTEQFIASLIRAGYEVPYDPVDVMQAGEELVRPIMRDVGIDSLDLTAGLALFHSSYMNKVLTAAKHHRIDPRRLIIAICEQNRVSAPDELIEDCAATIIENTFSSPSLTALHKPYFGEEQK